jgi:hypothetical protein
MPRLTARKMFLTVVMSAQSALVDRAYFFFFSTMKCLFATDLHLLEITVDDIHQRTMRYCTS